MQGKAVFVNCCCLEARVYGTGAIFSHADVDQPARVCGHVGRRDRRLSLPRRFETGPRILLVSQRRAHLKFVTQVFSWGGEALKAFFHDHSHLSHIEFLSVSAHKYVILGKQWDFF